MRFEPIAIVGRACVLPGAHSPEELWERVVAGEDLVRSAPEGRWGLDRQRALCGADDDSTDRTWSDRGGYVDGFRFDPNGYELPATELAGLDPVFTWLLHCGREALVGVTERARCGAIVGNLSFPSSAMTRYAESVWLDAQPTLPGARAKAGVPAPDPQNRFMSGRPAHTLARALGLGGPAFALDAACASSLFAIKLACDRLHDRDADVMLAGAVCRADDLFIHMGFCALQALSKTGRSRPFHAGADGLVPGEGSALVALMRLADAEAQGLRIYGVIRGVGVSNDGRGRGLLAPSAEGQERAIRAAYAMSGLSPTDIGLLECHATGTQLGDAAEIESSGAVFAGLSDVPIGSLKSNIGHLITTAGAAGLLKVLGAFEHRIRPPTLHADEPSDALAGSPFRLLTKAEPWDGPLRASVSAFGFGGNNGHVLVEAWEGQRFDPVPAPSLTGDVAIVALSARVGTGRCAADLASTVLAGESLVGANGAVMDEVSVALKGLRFPPRDLEQTLPQQLAMLEVAREAIAQIAPPVRERTAVLVGMGCDPEIARYGARWRLPDWAAAWADGETPDPEWVAEAQDCLVPSLLAAGVVGTMPNIPANRINSACDLGGPSFTVAGEELSGLEALGVACRALRAGEIDVALVGAVDLSCEPVHRAAARAVLDARRQVPGDAAVALVLKRAADARRDGDRILALIPDAPVDGLELGDRGIALREQVGHAHAAFGLVNVAVAALAIDQGRRPAGHGQVAPGWDGERAATVVIDDPTGGERRVSLVQAGAPGGPLTGVGLGEPASGPSLSYPAHAPVIALRPLRVAPAEGAEIMQPAPALPSILSDYRMVAPAQPDATPIATSPPRAPVAAPVAPIPVAAPVVAPAVPAGPGTDVLARLGAFHAQVAAVHQDFVARSAAVHQQYMALRARQEQVILQAARAGVHAAPVSAPIPRAPLPPVPSVPVARPAPPPPVMRAEAPTVPSVVPPRPAPVAPAPVVKPVADTRPATLPGPKFSRADLEHLASGNISERFGPAFAGQDGYFRQVRMPEPPLLLCDRVTGIDAEPKVLGKGTIWTETDVTDDAWYLHHGRMPAGVMIESGQADLLLISWMGIDFLNKSDRVYRLLGCDITFLGSLPKPGDTLTYDIHVDGHANQGPVRLMFFHYDCKVDGEPRMIVRGGQAGFFTDGELADSAGILWDPSTDDRVPEGPFDAPAVDVVPSLSKAELVAFSEGRPWEAFGEAFRPTASHVRTPGIQSGDMLFLDRVTHIEPTGGPWGRGYLRAEQDISPDTWFFDGHFKNDPCMPGTLMFEGCLQTMAIYLTALGFTIARDGWRFEPVTGETVPLRCRGQVIPTSKNLVYELFIETVSDGPEPMIKADLLCTVDGLKAFWARGMGFRLVPDWPMTSRPEILADHVEAKPVASWNGFEFGYPSLLACAWGRPSDAFGPMYERFDGHRKVPRLPGPPYHFITRVTAVEGTMGAMEVGSRVEVEYDVPPDAWYFDDDGGQVMPLCVLMEAALQPCGWLASYVGCTLQTNEDLFFRNLDGTATAHVDIRPDSGTLRSDVKLVDISRVGALTLVRFEVTCFVGDDEAYTMATSFGFFPAAALASQVGLPPSAEEREALAAPGDSAPIPDDGRMGTGRLALLDRVSGWWPDGGRAGLGRVRAEMDVSPDQWFFAAHFFQDPVQPGSIGIEAIVRTLRFWAIHAGFAPADARFEAVALGEPMTWKYRGQVLGHNERVTVELEVLERRPEDGVVVASAWLWVDGLRIYGVERFAVRAVAEASEWVVDPAVDTWVADHCPTWTVPALPMAYMVDRLVAAAKVPGREVVGLRDVRIERWVPVDGPVRLRTDVSGDGDEREVALLVWREARRAELSRFEVAAKGTAILADAWPEAAPMPEALDLPDVGDAYAQGILFHGPAFQRLRSLARDERGASAVLDATPTVPGPLNPALFDAATHPIPHDDVQSWAPDALADCAAYPLKLSELTLYGPTPMAGDVQAEVRFDGFDGDPRFPAFRIALAGPDGRWADARLVEVMVPKGRVGTAAPEVRRAFLQDRRPVEGLGISDADGERTVLTRAALKAASWLPGTVETAYRTTTADPLTEVAIKDHVAWRAGTHPGHIRVDAHGALAATAPLTRYPVAVEATPDQVVVTDAGPASLDLTPIEGYWRTVFKLGRWPTQDVYYGLIQRFIRSVRVVDPDGFEAVRGRPIMYLANHQTMVESLLFSILASGLLGLPTVTIAKAEHRTSWLGRLIAHCFSWDGCVDPRVIAFFDREDRESLTALVAELAGRMAAGEQSMMVHIEGTRSVSCRKPVEKMSSIFIDAALQLGAPIVPVRFAGGLPVEGDHRLEFPVGMGQQDVWLGAPIPPEELGALPLPQRKAAVIDAINALGGSNATEEPLPGDAEAEAEVDAWAAARGVSKAHATVLYALRGVADPTPQIRAILDAAASGEPVMPPAEGADWTAELARRLLGSGDAG